jgi:hypothetical protein
LLALRVARSGVDRSRYDRTLDDGHRDPASRDPLELRDVFVVRSEVPHQGRSKRENREPNTVGRVHETVYVERRR